MSEINKETVYHIAHLSRIEIRDDEKAEEMQEELDEIVDYAKQLEELDLSSTKPMFHALNLTNVLREDEEEAPLSQEDALKNSNSTKDGQFKVPKML